MGILSLVTHLRRCVQGRTMSKKRGKKGSLLALLRHKAVRYAVLNLHGIQCNIKGLQFVYRCFPRRGKRKSRIEDHKR